MHADLTMSSPDSWQQLLTCARERAAAVRRARKLERKRAERHQNMLVAELNHRVKNILANGDPEGIAMLLQEEHTTLGLSDAGAHVGQLCDAPLSTDLLGNAYEHRPSKAADANSALLTMSVDCRTGQTAENRIVWRDYNDRPLATQIVATKDAEHSFSRMIEAIADDPNLFDEGDGDDAVRKICAAAAAQCQGVDPEQLLQSRDGWTEEDLAAVNAAPNPAQALLVARARLHAQRNHLPTCRIGG